MRTAFVDGQEVTFEDNDPVFDAPVETAAQYAARMSVSINTERDRRMGLGSAFSVTGISSDIPLTGRAFDRDMYGALLSLAQEYRMAGTVLPSLPIRDADNVTHMLTAAQMIELITSSMSWVSLVMTNSWNMKDGLDGTAQGLPDFSGGIPADWDDDQWWPT